MTDAGRRTVVVVGATGDLGRRIAAALVRREVTVRALVRSGSSTERRAALRAMGVRLVEVDFDRPAALVEACAGAECVVSAVSGLAPVIVDLQGRLLDAAVEAVVPRFIPSDFALDFTRTRRGDNRNMDLRRAFKARLDRAPIRATSILNGPFMEILDRAPILLRKVHRVLHWGDADQAFDFTTKDDVADFTADATLDPVAPRSLRIAGDVVSPRDLAIIMSELEHRDWALFSPGGVALLSAIIWVTRRLSSEHAVFPAWQGMQYLRDMSTGRGKLSPIDNTTYGKTHWMSVRAYLSRRS